MPQILRQARDLIEQLCDLGLALVGGIRSGDPPVDAQRLTIIGERVLQSIYVGQQISAPLQDFGQATEPDGIVFIVSNDFSKDCHPFLVVGQSLIAAALSGQDAPGVGEFNRKQCLPSHVAFILPAEFDAQLRSPLDRPPTPPQAC